MRKDIVNNIEKELEDAISLSSDKATMFFKTGKGGYSEHDKFLGISVPKIRSIAKNHPQLSLEEIKYLLYSPYNEKRLLALIILVNQYKKSKDKETFYNFYCEHLLQVNNWNLVDSSAHLIIGDYLYDKERDYLFTLSKSDSLWLRRISIVSTWWFIRQQDVDDTFKLATILMQDKHDLIHKASGWMLREAGKKDINKLKDYLNIHASHMPRTMLRYSIEKLTADEKSYYMTI